MKKEKFYELLGEIDENYIEEAHLSVEKKNSTHLAKMELHSGVHLLDNYWNSGCF